MTWFSTALISAARAAALAAACVLAACSTPPADPRGGFATALARALPFAVGVYGVARSEPAAIGGLPPNADERGVSALPYARIGADARPGAVSLFVDGQHDLLLRGVSGLDDMPRPRRRIRRQPVGCGDHERQPAGPEPALQRRGGEQHPVSRTQHTHQVGIPESAHARPRRLVGGVQVDGILHRPPPRLLHRGDRPDSPVHHGLSVMSPEAIPPVAST